MNNFQQPGNTNTLQMPESVKYFGDSVSNSVDSVSGSITDSVNQFSDSEDRSSPWFGLSFKSEAICRNLYSELGKVLN